MFKNTRWDGVICQFLKSTHRLYLRALRIDDGHNCIKFVGSIINTHDATERIRGVKI